VFLKENVMNEAMKLAWLEISQMLGEPTPEELNVFLRAWQRAIQAEREECAKLVDHILKEGGGTWGDAIRARGQA
jgi:hypothetical protein